MRKHQSGFTLVELVVVIVILGILAAVAVPRFMSLEGEARQASLQGLKGSVVAAAALVYAKSVAAGTSGSATGSVTMQGTAINTVYGYPAVGSVAAAAGVTSGTDYDVSTTATAATFTITGVTTSGTCNVVYTQATSAAVPATTVITASAANCAN